MLQCFEHHVDQTGQAKDGYPMDDPIALLALAIGQGHFPDSALETPSMGLTSFHPSTCFNLKMLQRSVKTHARGI